MIRLASMSITSRPCARRGGSTCPIRSKPLCLAEKAGADGITVHLREDRRHIQERDVELLRQRVQTKLNLEMAVTPAMVAFAEKLRPDDACFVPEKREELTTEGGLDVVAHKRKSGGRATIARIADARQLVYRSGEGADRSRQGSRRPRH